MCRATIIALAAVGLIVAIAASAATVAADDGTAAAAATTRRLTSLVDTRIGTGGNGWGCGTVNPGAQVPVGAMRLGPDTSLGLEPLRIPFASEGGYFYGDDFLECFTHTHVDGAGETDWQNFGVTVARVASGAAPTPPPTSLIVNAGYKSKFSHATERAEPGYYAVTLATPNVRAEVTVSGTLSGIHRYTCAPSTAGGASGDCALVFDFCHGSPITRHLFDFGAAVPHAQVLDFAVAPDRRSANITVGIVNDGMFFRSAPTGDGGVKVWWHARIEFAPSSSGGAGAAASFGTPFFWSNKTFVAGGAANRSSRAFAPTTSGSLGLVLPVAGSGAAAAKAPVVLLVRAGLSFVSAKHAVANLRAQQQTASGAWLRFEDAVNQTQAKWEAILEQYYISGVDNVVRRAGGALPDHGVMSPSSSSSPLRFDEPVNVFYSAVYRTHMAPSTYTEFDGSFVGLDKRVHRNADRSHHRLSDLSLWDVYRSQMSQFALAQPAVLRDTVNSMIQMAKEAEQPPLSSRSYFAKWVMTYTEINCMVGLHGVVVALDAVMKGVPGIDAQEVFARSVAAVDAQNARMGAEGYVPLGQGGVGHTLEFAIDAASVMNAALFLGNASAAARMRPFAQAYRKLWDNTSQLLCDRVVGGGAVQCPPADQRWLPHPWEKGEFVEGNALQYRWYVPHDLDGLFALFRSRDDVAQQLEAFFASTHLWPFNTTFANPWYWAGNEPTLLTPFIFTMLGNKYAHRTNYWLKFIRDQYYFFGPAGVPGNDDYGCMSSALIFTYYGLYPIPPTTTYSLHAPRYDRGEFRLPLQNGQARGNNTVSLRMLAYGRTVGVVNYVANASVNCRPLANPWVTHAQLMAVDPTCSPVPLITYQLSPNPVAFGAAASEVAPWMPAPTTAEEDSRVRREVEAMARRVKHLSKTTNPKVLSARKRRNMRH